LRVVNVVYSPLLVGIKIKLNFKSKNPLLLVDKIKTISYSINIYLTVLGPAVVAGGREPSVGASDQERGNSKIEYHQCELHLSVLPKQSFEISVFY
jgi:hypothetical protein